MAPKSPPLAQLELPLPDSHRTEEAWPRLLDLARAVADRVGRKAVAWDLDMQRTRLDNALADRERHALHARALLHLIFEDQERAIVRLLAELVGLEVVEQQPLTPDQQLARLQEELPKLLGPEALRALRGKVGW